MSSSNFNICMAVAFFFRKALYICFFLPDAQRHYTVATLYRHGIFARRPGEYNSRQPTGAHDIGSENIGYIWYYIFEKRYMRFVAKTYCVKN